MMAGATRATGVPSVCPREGHAKAQKILSSIEKQVRSDVDAARTIALPTETAPPAPNARKPLPQALRDGPTELPRTDEETGLTLLESIREVLRTRLPAAPRLTLFGEAIQDPKGDVFGVARGLTKAFPGRVIKSALSESTIVGVSIGRALAGARPVAFIQFADFLPLGFPPDHVRIGDDLLADGGRVGVSSNYPRSVRRLPAGTRAVPCPNDGR